MSELILPVPVCPDAAPDFAVSEPSEWPQCFVLTQLLVELVSAVELVLESEVGPGYQAWVP